MRLTQHCSICNKILSLTAKYKFSDSPSASLNLYECGHCFADTKSSKSDSLREEDFLCASPTEHFAARNYQRDGVRFILDSDYSLVLADQMRLGKTPQALLALRARYAERTPCLIIVRAANLYQWTREYKIWTDPSPLGIWPIVGTKSWIPPGFNTYIISMDTIGRSASCKNCNHSESMHNQFACNGKKGNKNGKSAPQKCTCSTREFESAHDSPLDMLRTIDFKLIIADEAHSFKNDDSQRSRALVSFLQEKNSLTETRLARKCGIILLTGTPIKNRADEYFIPLNLVAPHEFPSRERFNRNWIDPSSEGKRIKNWRLDEFKQTISPYVLRREKEDVYQDLPPINRMYTLIEPQLDALAKQYNDVLAKLEEKLANRINPSFWSEKEHLMELRRICGLMKVMWTADYAETCVSDEFSENPAKRKLAIGINHKDVRDILKFKLSHIGALTLSGEDSGEEKDSIMRRFATDKNQILIINMLAGGVGMDFHYVNDVLILERQWSHADEEQFEFRFYNPDKSLYGQRSLNAEYVIAKGTIDEFWHDMVMGKYMIEGETIGTNWNLNEKPKFFKALLEETLSHPIR